jgi:hypothetical protein
LKSPVRSRVPLPNNALPPARKRLSYGCQARSTRARATMLTMLDGNEQRDCESRGAEFESPRQFQLPVGARRYADSKPVTQGAVPCTGARQKSRSQRWGRLFAFGLRLPVNSSIRADRCHGPARRAVGKASAHVSRPAPAIGMSRPSTSCWMPPVEHAIDHHGQPPASRSSCPGHGASYSPVHGDPLGAISGHIDAGHAMVMRPSPCSGRSAC